MIFDISKLVLPGTTTRGETFISGTIRSSDHHFRKDGRSKHTNQRPHAVYYSIPCGDYEKEYCMDQS